MATKAAAPAYEHSNVALLRMPILDDLGDYIEPWPNLDDSDSCGRWLSRVISHDDFRSALETANPNLSREICACIDGRRSAKRVRRVSMTMIRYVIRATGRSTPFGLFAGVAEALIGATGELRLGKRHRRVITTDAEWLESLIARIEDIPHVLDQLHVVQNTLTRTSGERLDIPTRKGRTSIRLTGIVRSAMSAAVSPVQFSVLMAALSAEHTRDAAVMRTMLVGLVRQGFLVTNLRAPFTCIRPLGHVREVLEALLPDCDLPDCDDLRVWTAELTTVEELLAQHNSLEIPAEQDTLRYKLVNHMHRISDAARYPLVVNLEADCRLVVPEMVAREAERGAAALVLLSRQVTGDPVWIDYHQAFCDRYGVDAVVPLKDVLDPENGLGFPAGYRGSARQMPAEQRNVRDAVLLKCLWYAGLRGDDEVVVDDRLLEEIAADQSGDDALTWPPHLEVAVRVHAPTMKAVERGDFEVHVTPARSVGVLTGRFASVVHSPSLERVFQEVPTDVAGAEPAQLSFPPTGSFQAENVCRIPGYLPVVISLGEHLKPSDNLGLDDIAVHGWRDRLVLVRFSTGCVLEPQTFHAVTVNTLYPPVVRFLAELPRGYSATVTGFEWGRPARTLPYLPRLRYGRTVLASRQWQLIAADLVALNGEPRSEGGWRRTFRIWQDRWRCPDHVELRDDDRVLRLNLTQNAHLAVLRAHLDRRDRAVLSEAPSHMAYGWIDGRPHELVFPLRRHGSRNGRASEVRALEPTSTEPIRPGSSSARWLYAKLFATAEKHDQLLAHHLPELLAPLQPVAAWFVRYRSATETDHLRLRLRTVSDGELAASLFPAVAEWATDLARRNMAGRLVFDTYYPEVARYGGTEEAMRRAEDVFVTDSALAMNAIRPNRSGPDDPRTLAVIDIFHLGQGFFGDLDAVTAWLLSHARNQRIRGDRDLDDLLHRQLGDNLPVGIVRLVGEREESQPAWRDHVISLQMYRKRLPDRADPEQIFDSLVHLHCNRLMGIDLAAEVLCRRAARGIALSWRARAASR